MMKNFLPLTALTIFFFSACQVDEAEHLVNTQQKALDLQEEAFAAEGNKNAFGKLRICPSQKILEQKLKQSPGLAKKRANIEAHTKNFILARKAKDKLKKGKKQNSLPIPTSSYTIPVYVHILYSNEQENISQAQIQSQIDALNSDFKALNQELKANMLPKEFAPAVANTGISFSWKNTDVSRKKSTRAQWGSGDDMKFASKGGSDAVLPTKYLNIWVCNIGGGNLGFAQYPGGDAETDGVVISPQYFGTTGYVEAPFNQGRTTTHEVGHWLNLYHIWGDGDCSIDDLVADTPPSDRPTYGCPSFPSKHCNSTDMFMNFMDYTDDGCMYMFTNGQRDRIHALFSKGGARESFLSIN